MNLDHSLNGVGFLNTSESLCRLIQMTWEKMDEGERLFFRGENGAAKFSIAKGNFQYFVNRGYYKLA